MSGAESFGLEIEDLVVEAGGRALLRVAKLIVAPGKVVVVAGPSGAGKSTLLRALLGAAPPGGVARFGRYAARDRAGRSHDARGESDPATRRLRRTVFGYVPQAPAASLDPLRSIGAEYRASARRAGTAADADAADRACAAFGLPTSRRASRARPFELSGGEAQRAALAVAFAGDPPILLLDEPTSSLDPSPAAALLRRVRREADLGRVGAVVVTHDPRVAAAVADEIVMLENGVVVETTQVNEFFAEPRSKAGAAFLAASAPPARPHLAARGDGEEFLRVEGVAKRYRSGLFGRPADAVRDATFTVRSGETFAIVGESGSGKSTLGRMLAGVEAPDAGRVFVAGEDLSEARSAKARAPRLAWQDAFAAFDPLRTVGDAATEVARASGTTDPRARAEAAAAAAVSVGLDPAALRRRPAALSGGERQRALLAATLTADPAAVVFDESFSALDGALRAEVVSAVLKRRGGARRTAIFVSHDLSLVRAIADRVLVMREGRAVECGPAAAVFADPIHPATRRLLAAALPKDPSERAAWIDAEGGVAPPDDPRCYGPHAPWRELRPGHFAAVSGDATS